MRWLPGSGREERVDLGLGCKGLEHVYDSLGACLVTLGQLGVGVTVAAQPSRKISMAVFFSLIEEAAKPTGKDKVTLRFLLLLHMLVRL